MSGEIFTAIVLAIISVLGTVISSVLIPYLKEKIKETNYNNFIDFVYRCVNAANQIYTPEQWAQKKVYVNGLVGNFVKDVVKIDLSEDQIDAIIEGFVKEAKGDK